MAMTMPALGASIQVAVLLTTCLTVDIRASSYDIKDGRHNMTMGARRYYPYYPPDTLLFHDVPKVAGSWFPYPRVVSQDVCYPPKNSKDHRRLTVTMFNVTDLVPRGEGGYVFLEKGGVNTGKVCLHLKTQRGKGYHFDIKVFGYYL